MITTIIFDLGEVYLQGMFGIEHQLTKPFGIPAEQIRRQYINQSRKALFHGQITEEEYWQDLILQNHWNIRVETLKKLVRDNFKEIHGTREIIEKLKQKGYKLGLLSVHAKEWIDYCNHKFDYHKLFHSTCYSFEVGVSKPDKEAFLHIFQRLHAKQLSAYS